MKGDKLLLLETIAAVLYLVVVFGSSFYLMDSLMETYHQIVLNELDSLLAL
jgi:hypothetical protein